MLWLALHFPTLPFAAKARLSPSSAEVPQVLVDNGRTLLCDNAARTAGVRQGMKTALVRSLAPSAQILTRDLAREAEFLDLLACWAGQFTPQVCLLPQGLLLEIGGCLNLFGGFTALCRQIITGLETQGLGEVRHAAAPVALGAAWLAVAAGENGISADQESLAEILDRLLLARLADELPPGSVERLASFGLRRLGEVRRLPPAALARRVGTAMLVLIDRAYGRQADLREAFVFPATFARRVELPAPVENASALFFAGQRLVQATAGWLNARQEAINECHFVLGHHRHPDTRLALRFSAPLRCPERILAVLGERLAHFFLPAPVETLELRVEATHASPGQSLPLFVKTGARPDAMPALVDRLRARFGEAQVVGLQACADHRPEATSVFTDASANRPAGAAVPTRPSAAPRPLWLLDPAQPLREENGRPHYEGPLVLLAGPERIEAGWWDSGEAEAQGDLRRDYFVALSPEQRWLWIYRDARPPGGWFLHGFFS